MPRKFLCFLPIYSVARRVDGLRMSGKYIVYDTVVHFFLPAGPSDVFDGLIVLIYIRSDG